MTGEHGSSPAVTETQLSSPCEAPSAGSPSLQTLLWCLLQVLFLEELGLSAASNLNWAETWFRLQVVNSPAVLTCGEAAGSHPAGASQRGRLCPAGRLVDVRVAAWIWNPSRSGVSPDPSLVACRGLSGRERAPTQVHS